MNTKLLFWAGVVTGVGVVVLAVLTAYNIGIQEGYSRAIPNNITIDLPLPEVRNGIFETPIYQRGHRTDDAARFWDSVLTEPESVDVKLGQVDPDTRSITSHSAILDSGYLIYGTGIYRGGLTTSLINIDDVDVPQYKPEDLDTIILSNNYWGVPMTTRFIVIKDHYSEAFKACQLAQIPYNGLNDGAKADLERLRKYIVRMESVQEGDRK